MSTLEDWPALPPPPVGYEAEKKESKPKAKMIRGRVIKPPPAAPKKAVKIEAGTGLVIRPPPAVKTSASVAAMAANLEKSRAAVAASLGKPHPKYGAKKTDKKDDAPASDEDAKKPKKHRRQISMPPPPPPPVSVSVVQQAAASLKKRPQMSKLEEEDTGVPPPAPSAASDEKKSGVPSMVAPADDLPALPVVEEEALGIEAIPPPPSAPDQSRFHSALKESMKVRPSYSHARQVSKDFSSPNLEDIAQLRKSSSIPPPPSAGRPSEPPPPPSYRCSYCSQPITAGTVIQAVGLFYHPEHFICSGRCKGLLRDENYYTHSTGVYCKADYMREFCPRCAACGKPVLDGIGTEEVVYHPACLSCSVCGSKAPQDVLASQDIPFYFNAKGQVFCENDYSADKEKGYMCQAPGCLKPITGQSAVILGKEYHPECVKCNDPACGQMLADAKVKSHVYISSDDGKFYCKTHLKQQVIANCSTCLGPIMQGHNGVKVKEHVFHRECMTCKHCDKALYKGGAVFLDEPIDDSDKKVYACCKSHSHLTRKHIKTAADQRKRPSAVRHRGSILNPRTDQCGKCLQPLQNSGLLLALGSLKFHQSCITCQVCNCEFPGGRGIYRDPKNSRSFFCKKHYIESTSKKCNKCGKFITAGKMITSGDDHFHADCFQGTADVTKASVQTA